MPVTTPPTITALPTPPDPNDRATFNTRAYPWSVAQQTFATQLGAVASNVYGNATDAATSATTASAASESAIAASNAVAWVSGTAYVIGDVVWSPINFQAYRRKTAGAGTADPSLDTTNWAPLAAPGVLESYQEFLASGTWTKPAGATWIYVEAIGGGGGARSSASPGSNCQGGAGGEYVYSLMRANDVAVTVTVTVGAGGAGGAAGGNDGTAGGSSSFGPHVVGRGGGGGTVANAHQGHPGAGSITSGVPAGMVFPHAGYGGNPSGFGGPTIYGGGGGAGCTTVDRSGGGSVYGGKGGDAFAASAGQNGAQPGGGGGANGTTAFKAGDGGAGRVRVWAW